MGINERIKIWRKHIGLSQDAFAKMTGVPLRTLKGYEAGTRIPGGESLAAIASTGVNLNWLLTGKGIMDARDEFKPQRPQEQQPANQADPLGKIREFLDAMDEEKREQTINELFTRVQEIQRIDELERLVKRLNQERKSS